MNQLYEFLSTNHGSMISIVFIVTYLLSSIYIFLKEFDAVERTGLSSTLLGIMAGSCIFSLICYIALTIILFLWSAIPTIIIVLAILSSPAIPFYIIKKFKGK